MLTKDRYLESFATDAAALVELSAAAPDAPVEHCGDWNVADLLDHMAGVWLFLSHHVEINATERDKDLVFPELEGVELVEHASALAGHVSELFGALDPDKAIWSWGNNPTGAFYLRRIAQETAVHLWDVRKAVGAAEAIPADIAHDGIDEMAEMFYPVFLSRGLPAPSGSVHLHRTDGEGEWTFSMVDGEFDVVHSHAKGDAAVRGTASDLNLALWERVSLKSDQLRVFGDADVASTWTALSR